MNENMTDITVVLDRSGSMSGIKGDTIGGFNEFLKSQQKAAGDAVFTLVQFDDQYEVVHDAKLVGNVALLNGETYEPRGSTALLDAIGRTINAVGVRLGKMPEHDRPAKVVFVILTDGHENASKEFSRKQVFDMVKEQDEKYSWNFLFLGAKQDSFAEAGSMGIQAQNVMNIAQNSVGTRAAYCSAGQQVNSLRGGTGSRVMGFSAKDYATQDAQIQKTGGKTNKGSKKGKKGKVTT